MTSENNNDNNNQNIYLKGFSALDDDLPLKKGDAFSEENSSQKHSQTDGKDLSNTKETGADKSTETALEQSPKQQQEDSIAQSNNNTAQNKPEDVEAKAENDGKSEKKSAGTNGKTTLKRKLPIISVKICIAALALLAVLYIYFDSMVLSKFEVDDKWVLPAVVYSRPLELYPDQKLSLEQMEYELKLLKYRRVQNPQIPGEYAISTKSQRVVVIRRAFDFPDASEGRISIMIAFNGPRITQILNADTKEELGYIRMDPVLLDRINRIDPKEDRIFIQLNEVPKELISTLLEIEDRSFYTNSGINVLAIIRAFVKNLMAHGVVEGGSTITQQLVKNYFLNSERSYTRKFKEIMMALIMNQRYTKDQILEAYMNEIYLGQNGAAGIYGFGLASYFYFGVPISELTLDQMALLVGIIKGPSFYDPWRHGEKALARRNVVLNVLMQRGIITKTEYTQYTARPLGIIKRGSMNYSKTPAFMGVLKREIATRFGPDFLSGNGIKIFTSLDPQAQISAEHAVENELNSIEKESGKHGLEAAMVVSSWRNAEVSAVVGSRTPQYEGFNRVMEGRRQVGSIIKPFVYLTGFHYGIHLGTLINDSPITIRLSDGKVWQPHNDNKKFIGPIPTYLAMARSMNVPTVRIGMRIGLNHVRETLLNIGLDKDKVARQIYPSMLLGTIELTPFEVAQIYTSLATEGTYKDLTTLRTVIKDGKIVYDRTDNRQDPSIDPRDSYLTLYVMTRATKEGTGRRIGNMFPNVTIATKTGTTNDSRDTWTVGIDSEQVVSTWVGFDDNKSTGLFGSSGAMRVYGRFLKERGVNSLELQRPDGIAFVKFNKAGNIVADHCVLPNLVVLPARLDKIKYVDENCTLNGNVSTATTPQ